MLGGIYSKVPNPPGTVTTIPGVQWRKPSSQTGSSPKAGGWRSQRLHLSPPCHLPKQKRERNWWRRSV